MDLSLQQKRALLAPVRCFLLPALRFSEIFHPRSAVLRTYGFCFFSNLFW